MNEEQITGALEIELPFLWDLYVDLGFPGGASG